MRGGSAGSKGILPWRKRATDEVTVVDKAAGVALWTIGASWLASVLGTLMVAQIFRPSDRLEWLNRLYCWGQIRLTGSRWRAVVHPKVRADAVYMFCQNHVNHLDHCTMYNATPHFKQGLELAQHFEYPFYGWFMRQRGTIPVKKGRHQLAEVTEGMRREIERGHSLLVFPEGHRTRDGHVRPFKRGVFLAARDLGIPVVPVTVTGMQDVMSASSWVIRPGHEVTVWVDEPIETAGLSDDEVTALAARVHATVSERVEAYLGTREDEPASEGFAERARAGARP